MTKPIIYSAINATVHDYAENYPRIVQAMKDAETHQGEAAYHVISAMPLTGPHAQANTSYLSTAEDNTYLLNLLRRIAAEGSPTDSDLTTCISFPWYHRDGLQDVNHPFYYDKTNEMNNRPFYATAYIRGGKIIGINMESHLEYTDGGPYDDRYYAKWPMSFALDMTLPGDNAPIRVGTLFDTEHQFTTASNLTQARALLQSEPSLKTVFIQGSGTILPAAIQQLSIEFPQCQLIAGTPLGSDSGDKCGSGAVAFCQQGCLQHLTPQLSSSYSFAPTLTQVIDPNKELLNEAINPYVDVVKASALWMRDYLLKSKQQGFVISMTEGFRSAYSLMIANFSIDFAIDACGGLENYLAPGQFGFLACKNEVLMCLRTSGDDVARQLLKQNMLTCVFAAESLSHSQPECDGMSSLVHAIGAKFQASSVGNIIDANHHALKHGLADDLSQSHLDRLLTEDCHRHATIERAQTTLAGMFGNLENKICLSNASATDVALGRLHAGGAGQEGPLSVTLALFDSQIAGALDDMTSRVNSAIAQLLPIIPEPAKQLSREEGIIEHLILQKKSPMETYRHLAASEPIENHLLLRQAIDSICHTWSITQPSRVALSVAPHLDTHGKNLDRYRGVRNSRDNQYFNNGRIELKLDFLGINTPQNSMIAQSYVPLRDYLQRSDYVDINKEQCFEWIASYNQSNQINPRMHTLPDEVAIPQETSSNLHVGVSSLHQTMFDYAKNKKNIKDAIQDANDAGIDVLLMPELCLTGYFGDGDFDWINSKEEGDKIMQHALDIARFAADSSMVISIGLPVFIEGQDKPCVGQALLHGGKIIAISLKTVQPDGEAEYEAMHFTPFDPKHGHFNIRIDGQDEPIVVGKPVVSIRDQHGNDVPIYQEQCAEAWAGVNNDGTVNHAIQQSERRLNQIATQHPNLLVLNPSGSKNDVSFPKTLIRQSGLGYSALALNPGMTGYVYANVAGDDNGYVGGDSDTYIISKGPEGLPPQLHQGPRHSLSERTLTSMVIPIVPRNKSSSYGADVTLTKPHEAFNSLGHLMGPVHGAPAAIDLQQNMDTATREYTETTLASSSWVLNTLRQHKKQCFVISLSGGADSTLGAVQVVTAVDLFIQEHAQIAQKRGMSMEEAQRFAVGELFKENFAHLHCKDDVLRTCERNGAAAAIKLIKHNVLVCVYMPTANSSKDTELSARTLIKGGPRYQLDDKGHLIKPLQKIEGPDCEGLGGQFLVANLQESLEQYILAFAAKKDDFTQQFKNTDVMDALERLKQEWPEDLGHLEDYEALLNKIIILYSEGRLYDQAQSAQRALPLVLTGLLQQSPPTWFERAHDLTKQNLQPRLRSICPWLLAALHDGLPLFTSNLSEAAAGYSTWAGDTSLGYENPLGGILKSDVRRMLWMYEHGELCDLEPMPSLFYVNHLEPSAELRPLNQDGEYAQTDEADLMPYSNLDRIIKVMLLGKKTAWQTYEILNDACDHNQRPLFKDDVERAAQIHKVCWLYQASQFKRTGGGNTPFLGRNLDPHLSQATPLHSLCLMNMRVEMNLKIIGKYDEFYEQALLNSELRYLVASTPIPDLEVKLSDWHKKKQPRVMCMPSMFNSQKRLVDAVHDKNSMLIEEITIKHTKH